MIQDSTVLCNDKCNLQFVTFSKISRLSEETSAFVLPDAPPNALFQQYVKL